MPEESNTITIARPVGDVFDCGGVEGPFGEQLAYRALDPLAGRLRAAGLTGGAVCVS